MDFKKPLVGTFCVVCGGAIVANLSHAHVDCVPGKEICQQAGLHPKDAPHRHPAPERTTLSLVIETSASDTGLTLPPDFRFPKL